MPDHSNRSWRTALEQARAAHPELAALLDRHGAILAAQQATRDALPPLDAMGDPARLAAGKPGLTFDDLAVDGELFARLWSQVDAIMRQRDEEWPRAPVPVASAETGRGWFEAGTLTDEHVDWLVSAALAPFLWRAAEAVLPQVDQPTWRRAHCPICGGEPDFAFLDSDTGARHLICARCDAEWLYARIGCPFCGNADSQQLAYYPSEDQVYRLYVCEQCKRYLKAVDLRQARHRVVWAVERIATAGVDVSALRQGYQNAAA